MAAKTTPAWPVQPALFLDLDGTLLEIAEHPSGVVPSDRLMALLGRLPDATGGAVAFISGREVQEVDRLLAPHRFAVAGIHGLQRRDAKGQLSAPELPGPWLEAILPAAEAFVAQHPGLYLENKKLSLALHYRERPELEGAVEAFVAGLEDELSPDAEPMQGKKVIEIKPASVDKGTAICAFMAESPFRDRTPVFVGDDVTDERGFGVVNRLGGHSIKVGSGPTVAQWRLTDVTEVLEWLEALLSPQSEHLPSMCHE